MFSKLIARNSRRNRKENGLFFSALLISVIAFYIILSLSHQDVMIFLTKMESVAVNKLMLMIPMFYGMSLFLLFILIYYSGKFQLERRKHEFGVYLMMGMRRSKLFVLLLAEDFVSSVVALGLGIPVAVLLSEMISLLTAKLVGLGIVGHQSGFSWQAVLGTVFGFFMVKLAAFLILSGKISRQGIDALLVTMPEENRRNRFGRLDEFFMAAGCVCLIAACRKAIGGAAWGTPWQMGFMLFLGVCGTMLIFYGLRSLIGFVVKAGKGRRKLAIFNYRQLQETVTNRVLVLAMSALLILLALCCFGTGFSIAQFYGETEHVLDYTFQASEEQEDGEISAGVVKRLLADARQEQKFSQLFDMKVGYVYAEEGESAFQIDPLLLELERFEESEEKMRLLNVLSYETEPHVISVKGYNQLLSAAGEPALELEEGEAAVYAGGDLLGDSEIKLLNRMLEHGVKTQIREESCLLTGEVQTLRLITDRTITLSFALIVPDEMFERYTNGSYETYVNGILDQKVTEEASLLTVIAEINQQLDCTGLVYESYLQNMGRSLFYKVSASYISIYLGLIFLIVANTMISVQFLMSQQKVEKRYRTLIRLGADYRTLFRSVRTQVNWYFGIPAGFAAFMSLFGIRGIFAGIMPEDGREMIPEMMFAATVILVVVCVTEWMYMNAVKRAEGRHLLQLTIPKREE